MELYQLRTFVMVADEGNLTRAAAALFTSQPAISAQIKALEEALGVTLFERSPKGMQLTAKGQQLYEQAQTTLDSAALLKQQAQALQGQVVGELKLAVHSDFDFLRIGQLYQNLTERHPGIKPHFIASSTAQILPDLRKGKLDGGFFFGDYKTADLHIQHLSMVSMNIAGPFGWKDRIANASLPELAELPWIHTSQDCPYYAVMRSLMDTEGLNPPSVAYADHEDAVRELLQSGAGLSLLRESDAIKLEQEGKAARWTGGNTEIALGFAVQRNRVEEPLVKAMLEQVEALWLEEQSVQGMAKQKAP